MPRRPGRPRIDDSDTSVNVNVKLPSRQFDELFAQAQAKGLSVPQVIREKLREREEKQKT